MWHILHVEIHDLAMDNKFFATIGKFNKGKYKARLGSDLLESFNNTVPYDHYVGLTFGDDKYQFNIENIEDTNI